MKRELTGANDQIQSRAPLGPRFRERQRPRVEFEVRKSAPPCAPRAWAEPVQAATDHQMQDEPVFALELQRQPLADAAHTHDLTSCQGVERWLEGTQQKWMRNAQRLQPCSAEALLECLQVDGDIGKLGHSTAPPAVRRARARRREARVRRSPGA